MHETTVCRNICQQPNRNLHELIKMTYQVNQKTERAKYSLQNRNVCKQLTENFSLSLPIILSLVNQNGNNGWLEPSEKV